MLPINSVHTETFILLAYYHARHTKHATFNEVDVVYNNKTEYIMYLNLESQMALFVISVLRSKKTCPLFGIDCFVLAERGLWLCVCNTIEQWRTH